MKKSILYSLFAIIAAGLLTGCVSEKCEKQHKEAKQARLMAQAKVSKDDAQKTALAKVPNSTVREAEIEKEHGKLVWSFDLTTPDTKDITEVNVDAITGDVVSVEKESAESEAKESAGEKK
ncbi:MAG: PepSY domain-containing protein [Verrucomicrobiota bacterium]